MSMTVHVTTHCTDLQVLKEAPDEMGIRSRHDQKTSRSRRAELTADIDGRKVAFVRNNDGCLEMVGDRDWSAMRDTALHREIPVAVVCREPLTQLGLCPIVAIGPAGSIRTKVEPPAKPDRPDLKWFVNTMEDLGDFAIDSIDPELAPLRKIDALLGHLDAMPEHERLHTALEQACKAAHEFLRDQAAGKAAKGG